MTEDTLFGHLAHRFVTQRENLATEGLRYILERSAAARSAILNLMALSGARLPSDLTFQTQAAIDGEGIPDLVGYDERGRGVLVAEAKFWAGLTEKQPVGYLERLRAAGGGVLAFIAPQARLSLLWRELENRCRGAGTGFAEASRTDGGILAADTGAGCTLVLVSWSGVLGAVRAAIKSTGDHRLLGDMLQLEGLCRRMDSEAFLPLTSEEMTGSIGRRVIQFNELVDEVYGILARDGIADGSGTRSAAGSGWYGRYCRIHGVPALIWANMWLWGREANTPLWLRLTDASWKGPSSQVRQALGPLAAQGRQVFDWPDGHAVPLMLPTGVERHVLLEAVIDQVVAVAELLRPLQESRGTADAEVRESDDGSAPAASVTAGADAAREPDGVEQPR